MTVPISSSNGQPLISLLHATRGRPKLCIEMRNVWFNCAKNPEKIEHVFSIDTGDEESLQATEGLNRTIVEQPNGSGKAFNQAAAVSTGKVLILMADDVLPPRDWDEQILSRIGNLDEPTVLAVWDGIRADSLIGWPILTRPYYEKNTEFLGPYHGLFGDSEFSWRAYKSGCVKQARDIVFFHDHPFLTGKPMDDTYRRQNIPLEYFRSCALFFRRNPDAIIVESEDHLYWLCHQKPDGEYLVLQDLPDEVIKRVKKDFPKIDYVHKQLGSQLRSRIEAIKNTEIMSKLLVTADYTRKSPDAKT